MLEYITSGKSGNVYGLDDQRILKEYFEDDDRRTVEIQAYHRLGSHPNIARYLGTQGSNCIILERGASIHTLYQKQFSQIPSRTKFLWIKQAAEALQHIHKTGIIHADFGIRNMIIVNNCLKIIDFEGCSIDGAPADSCYELFNYRPSTPAVTVKTDIFAYGCAVYEIVTGHRPYQEFETFPDRYVEQLYSANRFPDVSHLPFGEVMELCWHGGFESMAAVVENIEAFQRLTSEGSSKAGTWIAVSLLLVVLVAAAAWVA